MAGPKNGAHTMTKTVPLADRIGAGCGAAYVLLILVGNQMSSGSSTDPHPSGAKDLADLSTTPTVVESRSASSLELIGFLAFVLFLGWFVHALRQRGGPAPWLAGAAGAFGVITLAVKLASAMPMLAGQLDHAELSPSLARVLVDMNGAAFVVTFLPYGMFVATAGAAFLATGFLGRVAGWSGVVIGGLTVLVTFVTQADPVEHQRDAVPAGAALAAGDRDPAGLARTAGPRDRCGGLACCSRWPDTWPSGCTAVPPGCIMRSWGYGAPVLLWLLAACGPALLVVFGVELALLTDRAPVRRGELREHLPQRGLRGRPPAARRAHPHPPATPPDRLDLPGLRPGERGHPRGLPLRLTRGSGRVTSPARSRPRGSRSGCGAWA